MVAPCCPVVLEEKMSMFFSKRKKTPFMLELQNVKPKLGYRIPAVCHLDTTARVQTLIKKDNPILYKAINSFYEKTGVPLLCNTSLNDRGEPIINSPDEAFNFALRKKINVVYFNGKRILLKNHDLYPEVNPLTRYKILHSLRKSDCDNNPYELSKDEVTVFWDYKYQFGEGALKDKGHTLRIKKLTKTIINRYKYLAR